MKLKLLFFATLIFSGSMAQQDFSANYKPLTVSGDIPEIMTRSLSNVFRDMKGQKVEGVSYSQSQKYYQNSSLALHELFNSGLILLNDPITDYVEKIGRSVIKGDEDLQGIQFFTMRSNVVNAFVTPQGMVFVTQGLIAQLENEAQLAYILAHEIAHYKLDHNVTKFKERVDVMRDGGSNARRIKKLSNYSKDKEFQADSLGIYYYKKANYTKQEIFSVFDVLSYSYLPFDLIEFPKEYFNTDQYFVPEELFTDEIPVISFDEDYDDSKSSHPNIQKRRDKLADWTDLHGSWGNQIYIFSEEEFYTIRNTARFEAIRNDLYDIQPISALYNIFLLEKDFPDNEYLAISKAKAFSQLISLYEGGKFYKQVAKPSKIQGDPHRLAKFIREIEQDAVYSIALRQIFDIAQRYNTNEDMQSLYKFTIGQLAGSNHFNLDEFSDITYHEAIENFIDKKDSIRISDSLRQVSGHTVEGTADNGSSKYDKIRNQINLEEAVSVNDSFQIDKFYLFGLQDIVSNEDFLFEFNAMKEAADEKVAQDKRIENMTFDERKKYNKKEDKKGMKMGLEDLVLFPPYVEIVKKSGAENLQKSIRLEEKILNDVSNKNINNFDITCLTKENNELSLVEFIRGQNISVNAIRHMTSFENIKFYPVEREELISFKQTYGSYNLGFFLLENYRNSVLDIGMIYSVFVPQLFAIHLSNKIFKSNEFEYTFALFDLDPDIYEFKTAHSILAHGIISNVTVSAIFNHYLNELSTKYEK
jgi:hypothetical protein